MMRANCFVVNFRREDISTPQRHPSRPHHPRSRIILLLSHQRRQTRCSPTLQTLHHLTHRHSNLLQRTTHPNRINYVIHLLTHPTTPRNPDPILPPNPHITHLSHIQYRAPPLTHRTTPHLNRRTQLLNLLSQKKGSSSVHQRWDAQPLVA